MSELASVSIEGDDDVVVARLTGEIDLSNARAVAERLTAAVPNRALGLVLDLAGMTYLDSSGVSLIFDFADRLGRRQQQLRLVVPEDAALRRVLTIVDAASVVAVVATVDEAVGQIRSGA